MHARGKQPSLPHGDNDQYIRREDFVKLLGDYFDTVLYGKLQASPQALVADRTYADNVAFWIDATSDRSFQSMRVLLKSFHLTEWLPTAPGRYFTPEAARAREEAEHYKSRHEKEYYPIGKNYLILGGVGSVRLAAKRINGELLYFLGASSNGVSHQGLPVALPEFEYQKIIQAIKESGGCLTNIAGSLRLLPESGQDPAIRHRDSKVLLVR